MLKFFEFLFLSNKTHNTNLLKKQLLLEWVSLFIIGIYYAKRRLDFELAYWNQETANIFIFASLLFFFNYIYFCFWNKKKVRNSNSSILLFTFFLSRYFSKYSIRYWFFAVFTVSWVLCFDFGLSKLRF